MKGIIKNYKQRKNLIREKGLFSFLFSSSGYVLIIVLIITSLLVSATTEFITVSQTSIGYMKKFNERVRANFLARSGIDLCKFILRADRRGLKFEMLTGKPTNKNIDCYDDLWAINFPELPLEEGSLKIKISDESSKINLSILATEVVDKTPYYGIVQRFFMNMELPIDLADIIIDWVDIDDARFPYGAESSDYYQSLEKPYFAKNGCMDSIDELLLLKDFTPEIYYGLGGGNSETEAEENLTEHNQGSTQLDIEALLSFGQGGEEGDEGFNPLDNSAELDKILNSESEFEETETVIGKEKSRALYNYFRVHGDRKNYLNQVNKININTAPYRVIAALTEEMTDEIANEIIRRRQNEPFKSTNELSEYIEDATVRRNLLTVRSSIFKLMAMATVDDSTIKIVAIYNRDQKRFLYWSEE